MNEWYAKDLSRKQRAVVKSKGNSGKRLATRPLYGYKKAENGDWLIDEPTAAVVQKIFDLYLKGYGPVSIANYLLRTKLKYHRQLDCQNSIRSKIHIVGLKIPLQKF